MDGAPEPGYSPDRLPYDHRVLRSIHHLIHLRALSHRVPSKFRTGQTRYLGNSSPVDSERVSHVAAPEDNITELYRHFLVHRPPHVKRGHLCVRARLCQRHLGCSAGWCWPAQVPEHPIDQPLGHTPGSSVLDRLYGKEVSDTIGGAVIYYPGPLSQSHAPTLFSIPLEPEPAPLAARQIGGGQLQAGTSLIEFLQQTRATQTRTDPALGGRRIPGSQQGAPGLRCGKQVTLAAPNRVRIPAVSGSCPDGYTAQDPIDSNIDRQGLPGGDRSRCPPQSA